METTSMSSSYLSFVAPSLSPSRRLQRLQRRGLGADGCRRPSAAVLCLAGKRGRDFGGELVDENMAVLRKRIYELRMAEEGDGGPPPHWMEWEKRHHESYRAIVCEAVGMLQGLLLNTRPSVALGMVTLVAVSVPASTVMVVLHLMGAMAMILQ